MAAPRPSHTGRVADEPRVDANVDYGVLRGHFIRLDVQDDYQAKRWVWIDLTPSEARRLANLLLERADQVEQLDKGQGSQDSTPVPTNH